MKIFLHLLLALTLANCAPGAANAAITVLSDTPGWQNQIYLVNQIKGIGLAESYVQDDQNLSYVYDDALAAMAFVAKRQYGLAAAILDTLANKVQKTPSGVLYEAYDFFDIEGRGQGQIMAGNTAWLLQAFNMYQKRTGSKRFMAFQKTLADYLLSQQDVDGGIFIMPETAIKSTEHNLAAYAALHNFGKLNLRPFYIKAAQKIKNFLINSMWIASEGRFRTALPDPSSSELLTWVTDVQALGVLALGNTYAPALTWAEDRLVTTKTIIGTPTSVTGFDFNSDLDTVWFEGTLQMALAFDKAGLSAQSEKYGAEALKSQNSDGSLLLASNTGTASIFWTLQPWNAAAPTAWAVFFARKFNPLQIL